MGHDCEKTTQTHYGTNGESERSALFEEIGEDKAAAPRVLSDEAKIALVDRIVAELVVD